MSVLGGFDVLDFGSWQTTGHNLNSDNGHTLTTQTQTPRFDNKFRARCRLFVDFGVQRPRHCVSGRTTAIVMDPVDGVWRTTFPGGRRALSSYLRKILACTRVLYTSISGKVFAVQVELCCIASGDDYDFPVCGPHEIFPSVSRRSAG